MDTRRIFINCRLSRGSFSGEAVFEVDLVNGQKYIGVASRRVCRLANGREINEGDLTDQLVDGKLVGRLIGNGGELARVALPDGEAVIVPVDRVSERESEIAHVLV